MEPEEEFQWSRGSSGGPWVPPPAQKFRHCKIPPDGQARSSGAVEVQLRQSEAFVWRTRKRLVAHDAERLWLAQELEESDARLSRLREAAAQVLAAPPVHLETEVQNLQQMVNQLQEERDALAQKSQAVLAERPRVRQRTCPFHVSFGSIPPVPTLVARDLSEWVHDQQSEMQEALNVGDLKAVMELTSSLGSAAEKLAELERRAVDSESARSPQCTSGRGVVVWFAWSAHRNLKGQPLTPMMTSKLSSHRQTLWKGWSVIFKNAPAIAELAVPGEVHHRRHGVPPVDVLVPHARSPPGTPEQVQAEFDLTRGGSEAEGDGESLMESDTESCGEVEQPYRRIRLVWSQDHPKHFRRVQPGSMTIIKGVHWNHTHSTRGSRFPQRTSAAREVLLETQRDRRVRNIRSCHFFGSTGWDGARRPGGSTSNPSSAVVGAERAVDVTAWQKRANELRASRSLGSSWVVARLF